MQLFCIGAYQSHSLFSSSYLKWKQDQKNPTLQLEKSEGGEKDSQFWFIVWNWSSVPYKNKPKLALLLPSKTNNTQLSSSAPPKNPKEAILPPHIHVLKSTFYWEAVFFCFSEWCITERCCILLVQVSRDSVLSASLFVFLLLEVRRQMRGGQCVGSL